VPLKYPPCHQLPRFLASDWSGHPHNSPGGLNPQGLNKQQIKDIDIWGQHLHGGGGHCGQQPGHDRQLQQADKEAVGILEIIAL
jgi:hypothetical protein